MNRQEDTVNNGMKQYRHADGKRLDGNGLATRMAKEITGMMLAQAYAQVSSAGFKLHVARIDGSNRGGFGLTFDDDDSRRINVDVDSGFVKNSWIG